MLKKQPKFMEILNRIWIGKIIECARPRMFGRAEEIIVHKNGSKILRAEAGKIAIQKTEDGPKRVFVSEDYYTSIPLDHCRLVDKVSKEPLAANDAEITAEDFDKTVEKLNE